MTEKEFTQAVKEFIYSTPFYTENDHDEFINPDNDVTSIEIYPDDTTDGLLIEITPSLPESK